MPVFRTNLKAIGNLFLTNGHIKFSIPTFGVFLFKIFNLHILCSLFSVHCLLLRKFMNCLYYHYFVHKFTQIFAQIFTNFIILFLKFQFPVLSSQLSVLSSQFPAKPHPLND